MVMQWFLIACIAFCFAEGLETEYSAEHDIESDDAASLENSLFGFRPCLNENCNDESEIQRAGYLPQQYGSQLPEGDYEPQYHEDKLYAGSRNMHCLPLRSSTVGDAKLILQRHPDIKRALLKVMEDLISYTSLYSAYHGENCDPAMKLADFINAGAEALRQKYVNEIGSGCIYTEWTDDKYPEPVGSTDAPSTTESIEHPMTTTIEYTSTEGSTEKQCPQETEQSNATTPNVEVTEKPCEEKPIEESELSEEIIAEEDEQHHIYPPFVGSIRGLPGVHYPNYTEVPITSFSCADKKYVPGFYADLETGCQVFHVCYEHRRESFLCPVGTIFNQPILACDYWYSSNCSLSTIYYEVNAKTEEATEGEVDVAVEELITVLIEGKKEIAEQTDKEDEPQKDYLEDIIKFLPVKAKVTEFPISAIKEAKPVKHVQDVEEVASQIFNKIMSSATKAASKTRDVIEKVPEPKVVMEPIPVDMKLLKSKAKVSAATLPVAKVVALKTAVPVAAKVALKTAVPVAAKVALKTAVPVAAKVALKAAIPVLAKAKKSAVVPIKVAALKASVPVAAKAKVVAAIPKVAMKASIPALKAKMIASAIPLAKAKIVAPALKTKSLKAAAFPLVKTKMLTLPLVKGKLALAGPIPLKKAKLAKAALISPLTKKALALGYMKLLKAKKLALIG